MPKLLAIESSPRGEYSISRTLTAKFIDAWKTAHAGGSVEIRDVFKEPLPFVDAPWMAGAYTPAESHSPEAAAAIKVSNDAVAQLMGADHLVIGTSMYNFSIPAALKAWIDHICRVNLTFSTTYEGLVKGKKATVIFASGGVYTPGSPTEAYNMATGYLRAILGFIGITDVTFVMAGGSSGINTGAITMEALVERFAGEATKAAQA